MQTLVQKVQAKNELLPRIQELEEFFEHYPDHPKEAIIKEDLLRLGVRFSESALKANEGYQLISLAPSSGMWFHGPGKSCLQPKCFYGYGDIKIKHDESVALTTTSCER